MPIPEDAKKEKRETDKLVNAFMITLKSSREGFERREDFIEFMEGRTRFMKAEVERDRYLEREGK